MIDLIKCAKSRLTDYEIAILVTKNNLSNNSEDGEVCYSNRKTKNFDSGIFINIDTKGALRVEGSLHKYYNESTTGERQNYNLFTMLQAKEAVNKLLSEKSINPADMKVRYYEAGLNLELSKDCINYLRKMKYIEPKTGKRKKFYINPKFKSERSITTEFPNDVRINYKAYDKGFEIKSKTKKGKELSVYLLDKNILRIETVNKRVEKQPLYNFFSKPNLKRIQEAFFRDWENIDFEPDIICPSNTGNAKKVLIKDIITDGRDETLKKAKEAHQKGELTDKEYRTKREFIQNEWNEFKAKITVEKSQEEKEFRNELERLKNLLFKNI